ncbi:hypothetical protein OUZ56_030281 [Daphnia magna]|uniref:Uncharacterized protein n=1 Tax=Daphnia magna TaxID=35525 RepID=A0ABQ9ZQU3_9CRUS|nr:hypothetical protein OUZ56_030281 [Daphnia magna]
MSIDCRPRNWRHPTDPGRDGQRKGKERVSFASFRVYVFIADCWRSNASELDDVTIARLYIVEWQMLL